MFLAWVLSFLILEFLLFDSWIRLLIIKCFKNSVLIQLPVFWKLCPRYQFISHKLLKIISTGWDCKSVLIEMLELSMLDSSNQFYILPFKHFNLMKRVSGTVRAILNGPVLVHRMWTIINHSTAKLSRPVWISTITSLWRSELGTWMAQFLMIGNIFGTDSALIEPTIVTDGKAAISHVKWRI